MKDFFKQYQREIIGGVIGFLIAICFITIGFIKTIFVAFFVVIGGLGGHYLPQLLHLIQKN
ncbi:MAG: DUF2273 domain-containing protein [Lactobacillus sp.]|jgi:uncharacterized membrane protein|uniref:DUF2273 domain-containing protein n=1 Tax=Bombilactobacillus bombi TaxID=1303590 RepID=UPI000E598342|nr:DUF2273 domain-containing protein [Bombilactobacillus bombi]AXX65215.1 DUF2273 domain-containing protein [Bombilactobacillus bombi]MCO6543732.1 DUF2273 domain-containing protein [Lactobacillus sp.]